MRRKKFSIEQTSNGWILRWIHTGQGPFKEPYDGCKPVFVCTTMKDLLWFVEESFKTDKKDDSE